MRLIDATKLEDLLRRQMEMDWNKQAAPASWSAAYEQILEELGETPVVDAVPVVRCKDCYRHEDEEPGMVWCPYVVGSWVPNNWYCADGKRKGECE